MYIYMYMFMYMYMYMYIFIYVYIYMYVCESGLEGLGFHTSFIKYSCLIFWLKCLDPK